MSSLKKIVLENKRKSKLNQNRSKSRRKHLNLNKLRRLLHQKR